MKAVILAAGLGSRLKSLSHDSPKTMLEINHNPLIRHIILALQKYQISDIILVVGYRHEKLIRYLRQSFPEAGFRFIVNTEYRSRENIYSLYLAMPYVENEDLLIINSDIFCQPEIFEAAIRAGHNAMIVDGGAEYTGEATKVKIDASGYISDIGKDLSAGESDGEYIGILKLVGGSVGLYSGQIKRMVDDGDVRVWYPYAFRKILPEIRLRPIFTNGRLWEEIDTAQDYERAVEKAALMAADQQGPET